MATEGHKCGRGADRKQKIKAKIDKELSDIRAKMERLTWKMQQ
jgi:hypothetical protein